MPTINPEPWVPLSPSNWPFAVVILNGNLKAQLRFKFVWNFGHRKVGSGFMRSLVALGIGHLVGLEKVIGDYWHTGTPGF